MKVRLILCILMFKLWSATGGKFEDKNDKRLLLSDPSFMDQRLSHLESLVERQALNMSSMDVLVQKQALQISLLKSLVEKQALNISSMESLVQKQTLQIASLEKQSSKPSGTIFTRWGKHTCPDNTLTIYSGFAAGGNSGQTGGSPKYICLTRDVSMGPASGTSRNNYIFGAEFETYFWKSDSQDEDAPCAVCQVPVHTAMMILPGRDTCYNGWTLQYAGHLGSGYYEHPSNHDYVCIDKDPDYLSGGAKDTNGALLYPVVGTCGALQCPPYKDGHVITCAICTQ